MFLPLPPKQRRDLGGNFNFLKGKKHLKNAPKISTTYENFKILIEAP